ncbi:MAG: mismatch-specific DNA-glycosylase [Acidimicrobiales bacterium]
MTLAPRFIEGRRPTKDELATFHGFTVDDLLPNPVNLLFVGINPGLWTAAVNAHFARPGNRFWPALFLAGITSTGFDASCGLGEDARAELETKGIGITNLCSIATARADELSKQQLQDGGETLRALARAHSPNVVAVLGVTAYRQAFGNAKVSIGKSEDHFEKAELWILPNPSGLNAHESVVSLASWYGQAAAAAGITLTPPH